MDEIARLLTLLALAGGALTLAGAAFAWFMDETRRIRRTLTAALGAEPQPLLVARGRGVGIGFNLPAARVAVTWDTGGWQLTYGIEELIGVELIVDRQVAARAFRGEPRRPLDHLTDPEERVRLRFVFDDTAHPDFDLDLWRAEDDGRPGRMDAEAALHEANRWMARMESLLRRPAAARRAAAPTAIALATPQPQVQAPQVQALLSPADDPFDDDEPPWDEDPEAEPERR